MHPLPALHLISVHHPPALHIISEPLSPAPHVVRMNSSPALRIDGMRSSPALRIGVMPSSRRGPAVTGDSNMHRYDVQSIIAAKRHTADRHSKPASSADRCVASDGVLLHCSPCHLRQEAQCKLPSKALSPAPIAALQTMA